MYVSKARNIISMRNVGLRFPGDIEVFYDLNWDVPQGSFVFLTGQSGSGKTSLLRMIYRAVPPTSGHVRVFDQDVVSLRQDNLSLYRRNIGFVFQNFCLIPHLTVIENVMLPLLMRGVTDAVARKKALDLLDWVGVAQHAGMLPNALSGGQKQRVAIVRAVIAQPRMLLADEPTGNIDDHMAVRILYLFEEIQKTGVTVILATHNRHLAREFGHVEILLKDKRANLVRGGDHG